MGKNLQTADLVLRTGKLAFYKVPGMTVYTRMEGFTSLSTSKSATEYERQYVDEDFKRTDITGYNSSTSYAVDRYDGNVIIDDIIGIHEGELLGQSAVRSIIQVDMETAENTGGKNWTASARIRDYSVIPETDGDTTDCMTYSGTFKCRGVQEEITVVTTDDWQTISVSGANISPVLKSLSIRRGASEISYTPVFSGTTTAYTVPCGTGSITVIAVAESSTYTVMGQCNGTSANMSAGSAAFSVSVGDKIYITVNNGSTHTGISTRTYTVTVAASGS